MILEELAAAARARVVQRKKCVPYAQILEQAKALPAGQDFPFAQALRGPGLSLICEVKKASPSKGLIAPDFPYLQIAEDYEKAGAAAVSVLTEPQWFLGSDRYLQEIARKIRLPVLRKDFTVDPYMICEAKLLGASAVLLICALLSDRELRDYRELAASLGLSALVEAHTEEEIRRALASGAEIMGVNNRNLQDFTVDMHAAERLRRLVPSGVLFVSESGVQGTKEVAAARRMGADAVLVGEALMRAPNRCAALRALREAAE
ncbi:MULTISPECIES: indole-3-glycerol phosphate synthase TrpC [Caproicibacterium]|uniref:Indole-3-glycerol phosphate synthase n=1 Tax=Caproicibacterium argilliputei TaxID=3030016 RepID=A0AA97H3L2_9FIRM|nr:indole-3-glycerol phosphate synthase TrpC [Caproicibacterium argilliputei]WOC32403.1 indole-3-glycerol phosphate synthase TrpC [Caproicibacterium argilliputei]